MAKKIGVSPTYLSKVERDEFPPLAGRVASDLTDIIRERPRKMADFLRVAKGLTTEDMARLAQQAQKARDK